MFITSLLSSLFSHLHLLSLSPSLPLLPLSHLVVGSVSVMCCYCCYCRLMLPVAPVLVLLLPMVCCLAAAAAAGAVVACTAGATVARFGVRARGGHFEHRLQWTSSHALVFFSGFVRPVLKYGPKSPTVGQILCWRQTCKRFETACLDPSTSNPLRSSEWFAHHGTGKRLRTTHHPTIDRMFLHLPLFCVGDRRQKVPQLAPNSIFASMLLWKILLKKMPSFVGKMAWR